MRPSPSTLAAALVLLSLPAASATLEEAGAAAQAFKPALSSFGVCPLPGAMRADGGATLVADRPAPDFAVRDTAGNEFRLSRKKGKVVLLDFWATWCGPCRAAVPHLQALHVKHVKAGLMVVGLNNQEDVEAVRAFEERFKITYTGGLDSDGLVAQAYGVQGLPTLVLVDKQGKIVWRDSGYSAQKAAALDRAVEAALAAE